MKTEFEAKFLDISIDDMRATLTAAGAQLEQPMRLMRRVTIDSPDMKRKDAFVRVRDQGDKITLTYKQFDALSVDGAKEYEIDVSNFDETVSLLAAAGLPHNSFQESKRESWRLGETEIVIDEWPWLRPYIEIEGQSVDAVKTTAALLGLHWEDAVFGDVMVAYRAQYPHLTEKQTIGDVPRARFGDPLPDLLDDAHARRDV